nr:uncharacterized protein LOC129425720 [Misgurnus anguillicaudatus]
MHKPFKNPADWMYRRCARRGRSFSVVLEPGPTWYDPLLFGPGVNSRREPARTAGPIPLSAIPEGLTVGVLALEDPAITTPVPASSVQPPDLRGKRERRVSWESPSEGSSSEPAAPTTVLTSPATSSAPRPRKKRRRRAAPVTIPVSSPLPDAAPPVSSPLPAAAHTVLVPVMSPLPAAAPTVLVPVSSPLPDAAPPVTVSSPLPDAAPPVSIPVSSPLPDAAPPVSPAPSVAFSPAQSSSLSACSPVTVSMSSLNSLPHPVSPGSPPSAPLSTPTTSWNPALPPFVPLSQPASITKPAPSKIPTKPARTPRPKPSTTPEPKTPCPPSSTLPGLPHLNTVLPPPPLPCLLFLLCHPNPFVVYSCLPLCIFVMFSWCMSICQSVLSCV